ncbi:MAG: lipocalin family protein [Pseudomonadota bacterium]
MRSLWIFGLTLCIAGCAAKTPSVSGFRDTSVPLTVTTRGGSDAMNGPWFMRAHFPGDGSIAMVTFLDNHQGSPAIEMLRSSCDLGGDCETLSDIWATESLGLNRWRLTNAKGDARQELWVIWVDEGGRTAALGTPDGSFGWIVDRKPTSGEDRIIAAREILEFNGYNTSQMELRQQ